MMRTRAGLALLAAGKKTKTTMNSLQNEIKTTSSKEPEDRDQTPLLPSYERFDPSQCSRDPLPPLSITSELDRRLDGYVDHPDELETLDEWQKKVEMNNNCAAINHGNQCALTTLCWLLFANPLIKKELIGNYFENLERQVLSLPMSSSDEI